MSPLAVRRATRRLRRRATGVLIAVGLGLLIGAHHSALPAGDMDHAGMGTVVELCLGVFTAVGASVAALAIALHALGGWSTPPRLATTGVRTLPCRSTHEPRAGPRSRAHLCVWQR